MLAFQLIFISEGLEGNSIVFIKAEAKKENFCYFIRGWSEGKFSTPHTCCRAMKGKLTEEKEEKGTRMLLNGEKKNLKIPTPFLIHLAWQKEGRSKGSSRGGEVINKNTIFQYPRWDLVQLPIQPRQSTAHNKAIKKSRPERVRAQTCWDANADGLLTTHSMVWPEFGMGNMKGVASCIRFEQRNFSRSLHKWLTATSANLFDNACWTFIIHPAIRHA